MKVDNRAVLGLVLGISALSIAAAGLQRGHPASPAVYECPHYWTADSGGPFPGTTIPLVGAITNVPEYHDCQRFVKKDMKLDAIYAIWVRDSIEQFYQRVNATPVAAPSIPFGSALDEASGNFASGDSSGAVTSSARGGIVGVIWTEGKYDALGLIPGWSCLLARWKLKSGTSQIDPTTYTAAIAHVNKPRDCLSTRSLSATLKLAVDVMPLGQRDFVPPVARWDWDEHAKEQYIGMWCPSGWCEFHKPKYHSSARWNSTSAPYVGSLGTVIRQKGFYDEQLLTDPSSNGNSLEAGGTIRGTVFPEPGLTGRSVGNYTGQWLPVARISLSTAPASYHQKFGYSSHPSAPNGTDNVVSLCFKSGTPLRLRSPSIIANSNPVSPNPAGSQPLPAQAGNPLAKKAPVGVQQVVPLPCGGIGAEKPCVRDVRNNGYWYAKFAGADGAEPKIRCANFRKAPDGVTIPPVVRWRWVMSDEVIWIPCPGGCCEGGGS
jgi:hypothetical protein